MGRFVEGEDRRQTSFLPASPDYYIAEDCGSASKAGPHIERRNYL
jgi:hypothetical protein